MKRLMVAVLLVACVAMVGCGGDEEPVGCASAAHDGLACATAGSPEQIGVCEDLVCKPLRCEVDDDCNDRSGNDACRTFQCVKQTAGDFTGTCQTTAVSEGFECAKPGGGVGTCASGTCQ